MCDKMEDHTIISLFSIGAGVILLSVGMMIGTLNEAVVGISAAAIGIGAGVSIPVGAIRKDECP